LRELCARYWLLRILKYCIRSVARLATCGIVHSLNRKGYRPGFNFEDDGQRETAARAASGWAEEAGGMLHMPPAYAAAGNAAEIR